MLVDSGADRSRRQTLVASPAYSRLLLSETSDNGAASPSALVGSAVATQAPQPAGLTTAARPRELAWTSSVTPRRSTAARESVSLASGLAATTTAGSPVPRLGLAMRTMLALPLKPR